MEAENSNFAQNVQEFAENTSFSINLEGWPAAVALISISVSVVIVIAIKSFA